MANGNGGLAGILGGGVQGFANDLEEIARQRVGNQGRRAREEAPGSERGEIDWFDETSFTDLVNPLQQGQEVRIGEFTVPAQTGYVYGFGSPAPGKEENQGALYFDPSAGATTAAVRGWLRLRSENAVGKETEDHGRFAATRTLSPAIGEPSEWVKLPERDMAMVQEDSVMYLTFETNAATWDGEDFTLSNTDLVMAMTQFTQG